MQLMRDYVCVAKTVYVMVKHKCPSGILEVEDKTEDDTNDEILNELRRKQHELKVISQHNQSVNKKLLKLATQAMHRQDVHRKMAAADAEVRAFSITIASYTDVTYCFRVGNNAPFP